MYLVDVENFSLRLLKMYYMFSFRKGRTLVIFSESNNFIKEQYLG